MAEIRNTYNSWNEVEKEIAEGGGGGGYTPGNGIDISGGSISAKVDGTTVQFDSNGRLKAVAGPGGVTKEYVDTQDQALQTQINNKQDKITDTVASTGLTDTDSMSDLSGTTNKRFILTKLWDYIKSKITGAISTAIEGDFIASRALVTNASGKLIESQTSATELGYVKGVTSDIQDQLDDKVPKITGMTARTNNRIYQCKLNAQGQVISVNEEFNWSDNYKNSADNQLFTRKGANDMYVNYLKSTNGTLTKATVVTNDYSHYVKCGNIYQLSIGFQNSSDIAKDTVLYTLPETISSASIEMYIVVSTVDGNTRILQCGGGGGSSSGNQIKAKASIPAGYWFGSAIFIKV